MVPIPRSVNTLETIPSRAWYAMPDRSGAHSQRRGAPFGEIGAIWVVCVLSVKDGPCAAVYRAGQFDRAGFVLWARSDGSGGGGIDLHPRTGRAADLPSNRIRKQLDVVDRLRESPCVETRGQRAGCSRSAGKVAAAHPGCLRFLPTRRPRHRRSHPMVARSRHLLIEPRQPGRYDLLEYVPSICSIRCSRLVCLGDVICHSPCMWSRHQCGRRLARHDLSEHVSGHHADLRWCRTRNSVAPGGSMEVDVENLVCALM